MPQTLAEIARALETDKSSSSGYLDNYERYLGPLRAQPVRLLELGVYRGGSLLMWREYFSQGLIVGLDLQPNPLQRSFDRVRVYQGSQDDASLLDRIAHECAPNGFDVVIDDAAHVGKLARESFRNLFDKHLKPGGIYVIEDWGTGYWNSWADGSCYSPLEDSVESRCNRADSPGARARKRIQRIMSSWFGPPIDPNFGAHNFGMVGFVKELVDEAGWSDITHPERGNRNLVRRASAIRQMIVSHGQVILLKALPVS